MKILILTSFAILSLPLPAAILFQQDFEKTHTDSLITTSNTAFSEIAWAGYIGDATKASVVGPTNADPSRAGALRAATGPNTNTLGKNAYIYAQNAPTASVGTDYFFSVSTTTATGSVAFTSFSPSSYTTLNATWKSAATSFTSGSVFFAVETGGSWYVTSNNYRGTAAPSLDLLTSTWKSMSLSTAGVGSLSYNTASSFTYNDLFGAGQSITGVGFYIDDMIVPGTGGLTTYRIDDLVISDVPEISSSLLGLAGLSFITFRRRK